MSDWIPVPEFENVLIIMADLADDPDAISEAPVMPFLEQLKQWDGGTIYLFHSPPEAGEVLEDADPDMAARFALAAQMTDMISEACRDAMRRVFSRATVQRVVLLRSVSGTMTPQQIDGLFEKLSGADMVWAGEWPEQFALGMKAYHGELFSDLNAAEMDLRKVVVKSAQELGLDLVECEIV